jgi:hypothetical protein
MSMSELMLISSPELTLMASEYDDCVCEFITITLLSLSVLLVLAFVAFIFSFFFLMLDETFDDMGDIVINIHDNQKTLLENLTVRNIKEHEKGK